MRIGKIPQRLTVQENGGIGIQAINQQLATWFVAQVTAIPHQVGGMEFCLIHPGAVADPNQRICVSTPIRMRNFSLLEQIHDDRTRWTSDRHLHPALR